MQLLRLTAPPTFTLYACVLIVATVMVSPAIEGALINGIFLPRTVHIVQPNLSAPLAKLCSHCSTSRLCVTQLTAHHLTKKQGNKVNDWGQFL